MDKDISMAETGFSCYLPWIETYQPAENSTYLDHELNASRGVVDLL